MKMILLLITNASALFASVSANAQGHHHDRYCDQRPSSQKYLTITGASGATFTLDFGNQEPSRATEFATICSSPAAFVNAAVLWMPSMGHGSAPTSVAPVSGRNGCFAVSDIDFTMRGHWQIKVQLRPSGEEIFDVCI